MPNVTHACFGLSYLLALVFELARTRYPRPGLRVAGLACGAAGLVAHSWFLVARAPSPATAYGALLAVAWVLAVFYLYGALHYANRAWAIFVLPLVLALVGLAFALASTEQDTPNLAWGARHRFWGGLHGAFVLLASVGVCVGAVASAMYLAQARRLRRKLSPLGGVRMLSLERLEGMNRRAITAAFPLLSVGLLVGVFLKEMDGLPAEGWLSVKVLATVGLWVAFLVLLYLRYAAHLPGRRMAMLTLVTFALVVTALVAHHPFARGGESP